MRLMPLLYEIFELHEVEYHYIDEAASQLDKLEDGNKCLSDEMVHVRLLVSQ